MYCIHPDIYLCTTVTGFYLYLESDDGYDGQTADLVSPLLDLRYAADGACLMFTYHMLGPTQGSLEVSVNGTTLWRQSGEQSQHWLYATVSLPAPMFGRMVITGVIGQVPYSDMAVDDILVVGVPCFMDGMLKRDTQK